MGILYITVFVFVTIIASFSLSQVYAEPIIYDDDYIIEKFATGLQYPTTMYFVGDDILVLEKNTGKVIQVKDNGVIYNEPALDVPVIVTGESGLLGIAFASNHIYLYFTESPSGFDKSDTYPISSVNARNVVYQYDWDGEKLTNPILIKELPYFDYGHTGGVITKGQNNEIYFVIGDQEERTTFQNIPVDATYETSSIFKVDTESNNSVEVFAIGIRNSFGLAVDPVTGYLWDTENGHGTFDEINLVKPGFNSGWNSVMGPADRVGSDLSTLNPKPFENFVYSDPEFSWYRTVAATAIAFPDKDSFRKYSDSLFVGDYNNGRIYKFHLNVDRTGFVFHNQELSDLVLDDNDKIDEILFAKDFQGITDIKFHDGAMYVVVIGDGSIYKIYPKNILPPLKQYQNNVTHKKIVCKTELMPIMSKSGYIYCVYPKTALTAINVLNWSIDHPEMPKIELRFQDLSGLNFEYINLSNSDFRWSNFDTAKISNVNFTRTNLSSINLSGQDLTGTILTGADLSDTILTGVDLSGKDLTGVRLMGVDLTDTKLAGADLSFANLAGANLSGSDLTGMKLVGANLGDVNLEGANVKNTDFTSANLSGANLIGTNLKDAKVDDANFQGVKFKGFDISLGSLLEINFGNTDLSEAILTNADLSDMDLSFTNLTGQDLSGHDIANTILTSANLTDVILPGGVLTGKDLTGTILTGVDLSGRDLTGTILTGADLSNTILTGVDLSGKDLTGTILTGVDLSNTILTGVDLSNTILTGVDLSGKDLTGTILTGADLSNTILTGVDLSGKNFEWTKFNGVDLSGEDLSRSNFHYATFSNANMENTNLTEANFVQVDFTKIKNKSLAGANLLGTSLAHSNLSGVDLTGATLGGNNFWKTNLSDQDFTAISNAIIRGAIFPEANLSNANFEGISLFDNIIYKATADGDASSADRSLAELTDRYFSQFNNKIAVGKDVIGNDLQIQFIYFNNFKDAELPNVNFSNADLRFASFNSANLTNADLSGADLRKAYLGNADLEGANLEGAMLDEAVLTCKNHPVCV